MAETNEEYVVRRGYKTLSLMLPSRKYVGRTTVLSWSPVGQAYDVHYFPEGFDPEVVNG